MPTRTIEVRIVGSDRSGPALESAARGFQNLGQQAARTSGILSRIGGTFGSIASQAAGVFGGMLAFDAVGRAAEFVSDSFIGLNNRLEQSRIAFGTMMGSAEEAQTFLDDLAKFAAQTPFDFPGLTDASKRLMAFGFAAQDVIPFMTSIGDAAAAMGGGTEMVNRLTTALGQMRAKGKVQAEEMLQLTEAGIPAWDMLAKKLGTDVAGAMDAVEKRTVSATTMIQAFQEGVAARFGGQMAKQARTFAGALSTVTDSLQMAVAKGAKPLFDELTTIMVGFADWLSGDTFAGWVAGLTSGMQGVSRTFVGAIGVVRDFFDYLDAGNQTDYARRVFGDFGPVVDEAVRAIKGLVKSFEYLFGGDVEMFLELFQEWAGIDLGPLVQTIQGVAGAIGDLVSTGDLGVFADDIREAFGINLGPTLAMLRGYLDAIGAIGGAIGGLLRTGDLGAFFGTVVGAIQDFAPKVLAFWRSVLDSVGGVVAQYGPVILSQLRTWSDALATWAQGIDWAGLWEQAKGLGAGLLSRLGDIASQITVWLGEQWGKVDWSSVWAQAQGIGAGLEASGLDISQNVTNWLGRQFSGIQWGGIIGQIQGIDTAMAEWVRGLDFSAAGAAVGEGLAKAVIFVAKLPGLQEQLQQSLGEQLAGLFARPETLTSAMRVDSFTQALTDQLNQAALSAVTSFASTLWQAFSDEQGPTMAEVGRFVTAGIIQPIRDEVAAMAAAGKELADGLMAGMRNALRGAVIPLPTFAVDWTEIMGQRFPSGVSVGVVWRSLSELIPQLAAGVQDFKGGFAIVGEKGPELVTLPPHANVTPMTSAPPARSTSSIGERIDYDQLGAAVAAALTGMTLTINDQRRGTLSGLRAAGVV